MSRTRRTAEAIFAAGYPRVEPQVEPELIEQSLGEWQGLPHAELPAKLVLPKHAFWPLSGHEQPPGGETLAEVIERVGAALERLAAGIRARTWSSSAMAGRFAPRWRIACASGRTTRCI